MTMVPVTRRAGPRSLSDSPIRRLPPGMMLVRSGRGGVGMGARFVLTGSDHNYLLMGANARSSFFTGLPPAAAAPSNKKAARNRA